MRLAFFTDQVYWRDKHGAYSSDEAYTLFPVSFREVFDEVVLLGRAAPERGTKPYPIPSTVSVISYPYYESVFSAWRSVAVLRRALRELVATEAGGWDALVVCGPNPVGQYLARLCDRRGIPVAIMVRQNLVAQVKHGYSGLRKGLGLVGALTLEADLRWLARGRLVFTVGDEMRRAYRRFTPHAHAHAVNLLRDAQIADLARQPRTPEQSRLLFVGRLSPEKGIGVLFEAMRVLRERGEYVGLDVIGEGRAEPQIREQARQCGVSDQVAFLGYVPYGAQLLSRYQRATALVVPSFSGEGLPQVITEALAAGVPVVATRVGGIPDFVEHDRTALLIAPHDVPGLADALSRLLADPALRSRLSTHGQALAAANSLETHRDRIAALLRTGVDGD